MNERNKPEYELGDRVSFENNLWYVSGIRLKTSYELICWEFELSSGFFGDIPARGPEYIRLSKWLRHEQLKSVETWVKSERERIRKAKRDLELKIKDLEAQEIKLRQG